MSLLIQEGEWEFRRVAVAGPLKALAASLRADFLGAIPLLEVPAEKAMLSRGGGRCAADGTLLDYDPASPARHQCPLCGASYEGADHHAMWLYWHHLWLAERAVHAAVLGRLLRDQACTAAAATVLGQYADRYLTLPNRDNVLGPSRPFFSTYLESIWLLQLCVAIDVLDPAGSSPLAGRVRDRIVEPSVRLIEGFPEGDSNRQVWNNAALLAGGLLLGRATPVDRVIRGVHGLEGHLRHCLLPDGTWYEGENYHLFAHRGLWYGVALARTAGVQVDPTLLARFRRGFATPFAVTLPDDTLPSRRDSQYRISTRQWRFAEMAEVGLSEMDIARVAPNDPSRRGLAGALVRLYADDIPRADTGRARSTAEAERNAPPSSLTRADLGWRSLLLARPTLPAGLPAPQPSVLLEGQGIAVFRRRNGALYAALDYGVSGGGHGHPDRLDVLLALGPHRLLDDMGTGSYVDDVLHWYRSTLAHNAPLVGGRSQERVDGVLEAWDERGEFGWVQASAEIAAGVVVRRRLIVCHDYLIDELEWASDDSVQVDLPLHFHVDSASWRPLTEAGGLGGSQGLEDGFRFLEDVKVLVSDPSDIVTCPTPPDVVASFVRPSVTATAQAPAAPGFPPRRFLILREHGREGRMRILWAFHPGLRLRDATGPAVVVHGDSEHVHAASADGWTIDIASPGGRRRVELAGRRSPPPRHDTARAPLAGSRAQWPGARAHPIDLRRGRVHRTLGSANYRRSELTWGEAGRPSAEVTFESQERKLSITVLADHVGRSFADPAALRTLDNEVPDIHGTGIQLYVASGDRLNGWVAVPARNSRDVHLRSIDGWASGAVEIAGDWTPAGDDGIHVHLQLSWATPTDHPTALDLLINERPPGRQRRQGQLVLSGGAGEFVYLRGDRHPRERLIPLVLRDG